MTDRVDKFRVIADRAKKGRAEKSFILDIDCLTPFTEERRLALKAIGFDSLRHFITDSTGTNLDAETFINLAFAFDCYTHQACEVVKYLVEDEQWPDLLEHVDAEHQVECGARLNAPNNQKTETNNNIIGSGVQGTSKSYTLKRLARDAEQSPEVADVYEKVRQGALSANKAAISLGWRVPTITVRKDVDSAVKTLKGFFSPDEIYQIKQGLEA